MKTSSELFANFTLQTIHARLILCMANEMWAIKGRASGKTQGCTTPVILHRVENLPRSSGSIICQSFTDGDTKILPPIFTSMQMQGHELGEHYVYGCPPPPTWKKPYIPIIKYDKVVSFPNGTTMELISLHQKGSANSKSFQWMVGPEAKYFEQEQLRTEVFPTLRGNFGVFSRSPWYGSKFFETDKYGPDIQWILEKKKLHNEELVSLVICMQLQVNELRDNLTNTSDSNAYRIKQEIRRLTSYMNYLRKDMVYYGEGSAFDNIVNVGSEYLKNMKQSLTKYEYEVAICNIDPTKVENGFYPHRGSQNLYMHDEDDEVNKPLAVVFDYQYSISPLVYGQVNDLVTPGRKALVVQGAMHVKYPFGLKQVVEDFCEVHKARPCKEVIYFYDHTAVAKQTMHKAFWEEIVGYFRDNGWKVIPIYMGQAPYHDEKYSRINRHLTDEEAMAIRFHKEGCNRLLISMDLSEAKQGRKGTEKDKSKEKNPKVQQELTTHYSDTFDQLVWAVCELGLYPISNGGGATSFFRG